GGRLRQRLHPLPLSARLRWHPRAHSSEALIAPLWKVWEFGRSARNRQLSPTGQLLPRLTCHAPTRTQEKELGSSRRRPCDSASRCTRRPTRNAEIKLRQPRPHSAAAAMRVLAFGRPLAGLAEDKQ